MFEAACRGLSWETADAAFFPNGTGCSSATAAAICVDCPAWWACVSDELSRTCIHLLEKIGHRGGMGALAKRRLLVAMRDADHRPEIECSDDDCEFCAEMRQAHLRVEVAAGRRPRGELEPIAGNGPGATHGRASTHSRGCRCFGCTFARSTVGRMLSEAGVDVVEWLEEVFWGPDGEPVPTAYWADGEDPRKAHRVAIAKRIARCEAEQVAS
jgi:hypothetical protein